MNKNKVGDSVMEDYGLLAILVFLIFLLTVGLIITKKVEFVRALPAFGIVTAILAGTPITGSEYSIADYVRSTSHLDYS